MAARLVHLSKLLSLVLRHEPARANVTLDDAGWVSVDELLSGLAARGDRVTRAELDEIVATSDKKRFALSDDRARIRASQGHSVEVQLGYEPVTPPGVLFHGTVARFLPAIRAKGLLRRERHHVHLSASEDTALQVGSRRGDAVLLQVRAGAMAKDGHLFFRSANGVWLTYEVPPGYLVFPVEP